MGSDRIALFPFVVMLGAIWAGLLPTTARAQQAPAPQDGPVHGTVQSVSGRSATIQLRKGYRVEAGTKGTVYTTKKTFGQQATVKVGIRVQEANGRLVTVRVLENGEVKRGQSVQFAGVKEVEPTGTLVVRADPENAQVYLDDESLGRGTVRETVAPGSYSVRITADGYETKELSVFVEAKETKRRVVELERISTDAPTSKRSEEPRCEEGGTTQLVNISKNLTKSKEFVIVKASCQIYASNKTPTEAREQATKSALDKAMRWVKRERGGKSVRVLESEVLVSKILQRGGDMFYKVQVRTNLVSEKSQ